MVIDCHYHLEERIYSIDRLLREMKKCGIDRVALMGSMIEPFHEPPRYLIYILQTLLENRAFRRIGKVLISNFTDKNELMILGTPYPIVTDPDNQNVFAAVTKHPRPFLGWVFVNPRGKKNQMAELEKYQAQQGFIGVKAHPFWHHFHPVELAPVAKRLVQMGKPLLIHAGFGEEGHFETLLKKVPDLHLILAHAGFPGYADTWNKIKPLENVYLDLSQTSYTSEKATQKVFDLLGPDRLIFGTDGPYGFHGADHQYDYGFIKRRIERLFSDPEVRSKLLGGNFARLVGLSRTCGSSW
ncbi:MAG TPA: amidohydrolase family protein [Smithella sp.]|nr:amidohydrolase family protein [Smithella sp.]